MKKKKKLKVPKSSKGEYFSACSVTMTPFYVFICFISRLRRVGCPDKPMKLSYFKYTSIEVTKDETVLNQPISLAVSQ